MNQQLSDFYDLLGVTESATNEEIKRAYRDRAKEYHPDLNDNEKSPAQFKVIKIAYETLSDPKERQLYDHMGHTDYVKHRTKGLPGIEIDRDEASPSKSSEASADTTTSSGSSRHQSNQPPNASGTADDISEESIEFILNGYTPPSRKFSGGPKPVAFVGIGTLLFVTGLVWFFRALPSSGISASSTSDLFLNAVSNAVLMSPIGQSIPTTVQFVSGSYPGGSIFLIGALVFPASFFAFAWSSDYSITWAFAVVSATPLIDLSLTVVHATTGSIPAIESLSDLGIISPLIVVGPLVAIVGWAVCYLVVILENQHQHFTFQ